MGHHPASKPDTGYSGLCEWHLAGRQEAGTGGWCGENAPEDGPWGSELMGK